jgi:GntR family transcriptional repressor for pyruvate dehydrogenase complex
VRYRAAKRGRLHEEVVSQIQELIEEHQLRPGDKLPPERELTKGFDVSRTVVREAVRSLEERGLVDVRHGSGIYVSEPSIDNVTESLALHLRVSESSLWPLLEVREILEVGIAGLAAERATEEDVEQLKRTLHHETKVLHSPHDYVEADLEFHELLTRATHNEVLPILIHPLAEMLRESRRLTIEPAGSAQLSLAGHRSIYDAVKDGDQECAREAMRQHLRMVRDTIRRPAARTAVDAR